MSDFLEVEAQRHTNERAGIAGQTLAAMVNRDRQVGDVLKIDYGEAVMVVHDHLRQSVGGLPLGCFLLATRMAPNSQPDPTDEDTSIIVLRVLGPSQLPNQTDADRNRFEAAKRAADRDEQWDDQTTTDQFTLNLLRFAGLRCRVLGTFLLRSNQSDDWHLNFGADLSNFYSGRGLKVYKPDQENLARIVNFVGRRAVAETATHRIRIGRVRYSASEKSGDDSTNVAVLADPTDLLARRTALFGMSRTGKSNTTKIVASAVFKLRSPAQGESRVGQLILDPNGEYANENAQDRGAIKSIGIATDGAAEGDVVTYGLHRHPNDPDRRIMKLNFFGNEPTNWRDHNAVIEAMTNLVQGKEILNELLSDQSAQYISAFRNLRLEAPVDWDESSRTRYQRLVSVYRCILSEHLTQSSALSRCNLSGLTNQTLRNALSSTQDYASVAQSFNAGQVHWDLARTTWRRMYEAIEDNASGYAGFNSAYSASHEGRDWHDPQLMVALKFLVQPGGMRLISRLNDFHSPDTTSDYADDIVRDLRDGRLVIVDQSTGDPDANEAAATRLMTKVFNAQKADFIAPQLDETTGQIIAPPDVIVYVEEAHNLLPAKSDDLKTIWSRIAKEGSKFRIGLVYATQEPSSIQSNILKNTDNWFLAHLNNTDELREIKKYYDFEDFTGQILSAAEPGFLRMRTLSNPYTVPVQVDEFRVEGAADAL